MLLQIPDVLPSQLFVQCRPALDVAEWGDAAVTAGCQSGQVKHKAQLAENVPLAQELGDSLQVRFLAGLYHNLLRP